MTRKEGRDSRKIEKKLSAVCVADLHCPINDCTTVLFLQPLGLPHPPACQIIMQPWIDIHYTKYTSILRLRGYPFLNRQVIFVLPPSCNDTIQYDFH